MTRSIDQSCQAQLPLVLLTANLPPSETSVDRVVKQVSNVTRKFGIRVINSKLPHVSCLDQPIFENEHLNLLVLQNVNVTHLTDGLYAPHLKQLKIKNSVVLKLKTGFEGVYSLELLEISRSWMECASDQLDVLVSGRQLRKVLIEYSHMKDGHVSKFKEQEKLEWLSLEGNHIRIIERSSFPSEAKHLWYLNLSENKIEDLEAMNLWSLPVLRELHIRNNRLKSLYHLGSLGNLQELWAEGNNLVECESICWLFRLKTGRLSLGLGWKGSPCINDVTNTLQSSEAFCKTRKC